MSGMRMVTAAVAIGLLTGAAPPPLQDFCERMAPQVGLKKGVTARGKDATTEWRVDTASFGQHLFGGTVATSVRVESIDDASVTPDEDKRLRAMCSETRKGAECAVAGRAVLRMGTRRGLVRETAAAGERATVGIRGTTVYCRPD